MIPFGNTSNSEAYYGHTSSGDTISLNSLPVLETNHGDFPRYLVNREEKKLFTTPSDAFFSARLLTVDDTQLFLLRQTLPDYTASVDILEEKTVKLDH